MRSPKVSHFILTIITVLCIILANANLGLAQFNPIKFTDPFQYKYGFENLQLFSSASDKPKASVVIDGRKIFAVSEIQGLSAAARAEEIQNQIAKAIAKSLQSQKKAQVRVEEGNTIYANGVRILNLTSADNIEDRSLKDTALVWKENIKEAIDEAVEARSIQSLRQKTIVAGIIIFLTILGNRLLGELQKYPLRKAIQRIVPRFSNNIDSQPSNLTTLFRLKVGFAQFALWITTIFAISELFYFFRHWRYLIFNTFNKSVFDFGGSQFSIIKLVFLIGLFFASIMVSGYITNLLRTRILQVTKINRGSQEVVLIITKYGLICFSTIILLQAYGLNLSSLALIGSALGVGIGFGLQDIARNFASGMVLLFERSVQVGDFIEVGEHMGTVERVGARSIVLKTLDRIAIIVPNSRLLAEEVINWNHRNSASRLHIPVSVDYGSDIEKVKSALLQAAEEHLEVLRNPAPQVCFTGFGDNSLDFELFVWMSDPSRQVMLKSDLNFRIAEIFQAQELTIPFPQRDLHLRTGELPVKLPPQLEGHLLYLLKGLIANQYSNGKK